MYGNPPKEIRMSLNTIEEAIEDIRAGKVVIVVDDEDRENEGDFVAAASKVSPEMINFMATEGRGLICTPILPARAAELDLPPMVNNNTDPNKTAFTVSIDRIGEGCTTGISAYDRYMTVKSLVDPAIKPEQLARPGHIFPLIAKQGGVLRRVGHTEAAVDLARLAGLEPAGVIVEIMNEDGTMARLPELVEIANKHAIKIGTISDLIAYRRRHDNLVRETGRETITSEFGGEWEMRIFTDMTHEIEHVVLIKGDITTDEPVLVRTHALQEAQDVLGLGPKPADELPRAMKIIADEGRGVVCLFREPRKTLHADEEEGPRTVRQIGLGSQILSTLGLNEMVLLTDSPETRYVGLDAYGLTITGTRPIQKD